MLALIESKFGLNYKEWVRKLKENENSGQILVRAKCSYLGQEGIISRADLNEISADLDAIVNKPAHTIFSDESKAIAGTDKHPSPLLYFVAAAGFCFLSTFAIHASVKDVKIESVELDVRGFFDLNGYYNTKPVPVGITRLDYNLRVKTTESQSTIEQLIRETENHCPVYQTLTHPPKIEMSIDITSKQ